jgi:hypothetical protein
MFVLAARAVCRFDPAPFRRVTSGIGLARKHRTLHSPARRQAVRRKSEPDAATDDAAGRVCQDATQTASSDSSKRRCDPACRADSSDELRDGSQPLPLTIRTALHRYTHLDECSG